MQPGIPIPWCMAGSIKGGRSHNFLLPFAAAHGLICVGANTALNDNFNSTFGLRFSCRVISGVTSEAWAVFFPNLMKRKGPPRRDLLLRIAEKLQLDEATGCWNWTGKIRPDGYAKINTGGHQGPMDYVHRLMYELLIGPIPDGLVIDHAKCRNRKCGNPYHLEPKTIAENADCWRRQTHCIHGHPFNELNTWVKHNPNGSIRRHCRTCLRLRARKRQHTKTPRVITYEHCSHD